MGWNGLDLVNDFSSELGDVSPAFKTKVLRWLNEGLREIATSHQWPFLREKGKVLLTAKKDTHAITLAKPAAPVVSLATGGSLALTFEYRVLVTFFEGVSGVESIAGEPSASIFPTGATLSILLSSIPVSSSPLVTARKVYVSKGGGLFAYHGTIPNNLAELPAFPVVIPADPAIPVTYSVASETFSALTPPEENSIHMVDGDFYIEDSWMILGTSLQDLIFSSNGVGSFGQPSQWAPINHEEIQVNPKPSKDTVASFYYFKIPARVFGVTTSIPQLPSWLYEDVKNYVLWRGFSFRDRAGKQEMKNNYESGLKVTISRKGKAIKRSMRVRSVTGDSDGYGV